MSAPNLMVMTEPPKLPSTVHVAMDLGGAGKVLYATVPVYVSEPALEYGEEAGYARAVKRAKLIAAGPRLLDAAIDLIDSLENWAPICGTPGMLEECGRLRRAVIDATGPS